MVRLSLPQTDISWRRFLRSVFRSKVDRSPRGDQPDDKSVDTVAPVAPRSTHTTQQSVLQKPDLPISSPPQLTLLETMSTHNKPALDAIDLSPAAITANVHATNANCQDERLKFIFKNLIDHLHDFVRETSITTEEWMASIEFLTETGKMSTDIRKEFILLSDALGVSSLIDSLNNAKPPGASEPTVLGPFFTEDAHDIANGDSIASEGKGDYMFVEGRVLDLKGNPIAGAIIDTWETDGFGSYDTQYSDRDGPDCRGRLHSAEDGSYAFRAVVPIGYSLPPDGTVNELLTKLGRHAFRPAHLHIMIQAPGFDKLTTALYFKDDQYLNSDAVFGVRTSLIVEPELITDVSLSKARGFKDAKPHLLVKRDWILATLEESAKAKKAAMPALAQ